MLHTVVLHKKDMYMTVHGMAVKTLVIHGTPQFTLSGVMLVTRKHLPIFRVEGDCTIVCLSCLLFKSLAEGDGWAVDVQGNSWVSVAGVLHTM